MVKFIKSLLNYRRCKRAFRRADRLAANTANKHLVLMIAGRPRVLSKRDLRDLIHKGVFTKDFTFEKAMSMAIYKTRR